MALKSRSTCSPARRNPKSRVNTMALKLRVNAPPVEGKANAAVIAFVAERRGGAKNRVALIAGELNRHKRVAVQGVTLAFVRDQLSQKG